MKYAMLFLTIAIMSFTDRSTDAVVDSAVSDIMQSSLTGTYWKLIELNGKHMEGKTAKEMYLQIDPASPQLKSHSGCNLVMGEAKVSGPNQLRFTNLLNTTSECKTPEIDAEFLKTMESIRYYSIKGNILTLGKGSSDTAMKFMAKN